MSALIDPKPGDVVETPDGRLRIVLSKRYGDTPGDIRYSDGKEPRAGDHICWITTWREWCRKNKAVEVSTNNNEEK